MLAAALVAPQILYTEHQRTMVARTEIAILDLADSRASYGDGIFGLCHLDALLGMPGLAADLQQCRAVYRAAVDALCERLLSAVSACRSLGRGSDQILYPPTPHRPMWMTPKILMTTRYEYRHAVGPRP
jgi:hypothetical protein